MKAGRMRDTIIFKSLDPDQTNEDGTPKQSFSEVLRVKGHVVFLRGKGYFENYQYLYEVKGRIFIRFRTDIKLNYRVSIDNQDYDIETIKPVDNKRRELEIVFKAVEL